MRVLTHIGAVALALLVAGQSVAATLPAQLVCRFTGRVMKVDCPCPEKGEEQPKLSRESCCELRGATDAPPPGQVPASEGRIPLSPLAVPSVAQDGAALAVRAEWSPVPEASPPRATRLFVRLRHLLI